MESGILIAGLQRWVPLMQQVFEAKYYVDRALDVGHPPQFGTVPGMLEFLVYFRAALISYGKCYVSAGPGKRRLDVKAVFAADAELLNAHQRIMELRHKYVAHSDTNEIEGSAISCEDSGTEIVVRLTYEFSFPFDRLYELNRLIKHVTEHVVDSHNAHVAAIGKRLGKPVRIRQGD